MDCFKVEGDAITFTNFISLRCWKARRVNEVDILVEVQETLRETSEGQPVYQLIRSTVRVNYYAVDSNVAQLMHGIHFDFGGRSSSRSPTRAHPIFHAQISHELIELPDERKSELEVDYSQRGCAKCFDEARIPTCDMTFSSVFLCLAADHFEAGHFSEFREKLRAFEASLPRPECSKMRDSLITNPDRFHSLHWYAHHE